MTKILRKSMEQQLLTTLFLKGLPEQNSYYVLQI